MADPTETEDHEIQPPAHNWRKELTDQAKAAEARADKAERELAFTKAGLDDLTPKQVKALLSAHEDGPITADAIKATADELGFAPPPKTAEEEVDPEQAQREQELASLSKIAGSAPSAPDPQTTVDDVHNMSPDEIKAYLFGNADQFGTPPV